MLLKAVQGGLPYTDTAQEDGATATRATRERASAGRRHEEEGSRERARRACGESAREHALSAVEAACALCRPACPNGACCLQTVLCALSLGPFMALATRRGSDASEDEPGHGWVEELKISQIEQSKLEEELRQIKESTTIRESKKSRSGSRKGQSISSKPFRSRVRRSGPRKFQRRACEVLSGGRSKPLAPLLRRPRSAAARAPKRMPPTRGRTTVTPGARRGTPRASARSRGRAPRGSRWAAPCCGRSRRWASSRGEGCG